MIKQLLIFMLFSGSSIISMQIPIPSFPLHKMVEQNSPRGVKNLLADGVMSPNAHNELDEAPLHLAAYMGRTVALSELLKAHADPNDKDSFQQSALIYAAFPGNWRCVFELVGAGANVNDPDEEGNTALHYAVEHQHIPAIKRLHGAGADINAVNDYGKAPLTIALQQKNPQITLILLEAGAQTPGPLTQKQTEFIQEIILQRFAMAILDHRVRNLRTQRELPPNLAHDVKRMRAIKRHHPWLFPSYM